jgi:hypothetical protein
MLRVITINEMERIRESMVEHANIVRALAVKDDEIHERLYAGKLLFSPEELDNINRVTLGSMNDVDMRTGGYRTKIFFTAERIRRLHKS